MRARPIPPAPLVLPVSPVPLPALCSLSPLCPCPLSACLPFAHTLHESTRSYCMTTTIERGIEPTDKDCTCSCTLISW